MTESPGFPDTLPRYAAVGATELVAGAVRNEEWAWAALVARYGGLVSSITWSYGMTPDDSAEVGQCVWLRLFESIHDIRDAERIAGWIRTVAANECQRVFRTSRREVLGIDEAAFDDRASDEMVWGALLADELEAAVRGALARVPGKGRVLLETQLAEPGVPYAELAARLDMAQGSVGPTRQRSLKMLRSAPELAGLKG